MSLTLPPPSGFAAAFTCYAIGVMLGCALSGTKADLRSPQNSLERQLRSEVRELISKIILNALERDQVPSLPGIIRQCPQHLSSNRAWKIWTEESSKVLQSMLTEG